mgnify:FL=1|jgi:adenine-specific DNA-methyltransferase
MEIRNFVSKITSMKDFKNDIPLLERFLIRFYVDFNSIENLKNSKTLMSYCFVVNEDLYNNFEMKINSYFEKNNIHIFTLDMLINIFELLIPKEERKNNGMIFTPKSIKVFIIENLILRNKKNVNQIKICDPACGSSSFLLTMAKYINENYSIPYQIIFENMLYGVDISCNNIEKSILLSHLMALQGGEVLREDTKFNFVTSDSLSLNFREEFPDVFDQQSPGFDLVIGNPPYIRARNISPEVKESLSRWEVSKIGNTDLYISFFELGLDILNTHGIMGYISVNSYLTSLNGRNLRGYLSGKNYHLDIVNFKDTQIFRDVTSYTCITIINKGILDGELSYAILNNLWEYDSEKLTKFSLINLDNKNGWNLGTLEVVENITKMRRFRKTLGDYGLKNGIATLSNDIYIITADKIDDDYLYFHDKNGEKQKVEKEICKKILKPNIMKNQEDLINKLEYIIFPYTQDNVGKYSIISEKYLFDEYPYTFQYLESFREQLIGRDKGKALDRYPVWYAFGRTQGLNNWGKKLLLPYMAGEPIAILSIAEDMLFYCGYALFSEDIQELNLLQKIIYSKVFWYYVEHTSKPYAKGYRSFAKNYLKDFSVPDLTSEQKKILLNENNPLIIDKLLQDIYDVTII